MSSVVEQSPVSVTDLAADLNSSPLQQLHSPFLEQTGINVFVKRDDLIHPHFGGNKWRKLKYNLAEARENQHDTLLTFGGAWSNHIYATAAAARHFGFNSIGIIRGEKHTPLNPTLTFAEACGMQLHYVSRDEYRHKHENQYLQKLKQKFGDTYILPEGGSNTLAMKGCKEIIDEINQQITQPFDVICCASGTGATLAGLIAAIDPAKQNTCAIGFSALKGGSFLNDEVKNFLGAYRTDSDLPSIDWKIEDRYHFGGYAKTDDELLHFMAQFQSEYGFALDAVYTGKMFYGLFKQIESGAFKHGSSIIAIHSGGLQGNKGFNL